jgi:hypothetical protein
MRTLSEMQVRIRTRLKKQSTSIKLKLSSFEGEGASACDQSTVSKGRAGLRSKQDIRPALVVLESESAEAIAEKFPELARLASLLYKNCGVRPERGGNPAASMGERRTDIPRLSDRLDLAFRSLAFKTRFFR